jgi:hypothetical protein
MKPLTIPDKEEMILALQDEIRRSDQARYDHRLHGGPYDGGRARPK